MPPEILKFLNAIRPSLDKIRAGADVAEKMLAGVQASKIGSIALSVAEKIPDAGPLIPALLALVEIADAELDAIDSTIDAFVTPPAAIPQAGLGVLVGAPK
jgi:hypothetical protein